MFEPIPNFGNSLPNRIVPLKTMRRMAMERAIPAMNEGTNPFLDQMLNHPAEVAPMGQCGRYGDKPDQFGIDRAKPSDRPAKVRRQPQPYIFVGGKRVSTGPSKRWSGK